MKTLALAATILAVSAVAASAADLHTKAPTRVAEVFNWTGFYVGGNAGYAWNWAKATDARATNGGCWNVCGSQWTAHGDGFTGGGQAGWNQQYQNYVFGLEGEYGYLGGSGSAAAQVNTNTLVNTGTGEFWSARVRIGGLVNPGTLLYATGGYFGTTRNSTVNDNGSGNHVNTGSASKSGWTVGGGAEVKINPYWSWKLEYLHYDLGTKKVGGLINGVGPVTQFFDINSGGDIVRVGLNYKFGN
jgi:outer membrane immunogenic protein